MQNFKKLLVKNTAQGFTLLELMIVVIILGILAAISIPQLLAMVSNARETEIQTQVASLVRAQNAYFLEKGNFVKITRQQMRDNEHNLDVTIANDKYDIRADLDIQYNAVRVKTTALINYRDTLKNYIAGLHYSGGMFASVTCQTNDPGGNTFFIARFTLSGDGPNAQCDLNRSKEIR